MSTSSLQFFSTETPGRLQKLRSLTRATRHLSDVHTLHEIYEGVVQGAVDMLDAGAAVFLVRDGELLRAVAAQGVDTAADVWSGLTFDGSLHNALVHVLGNPIITAPLVSGDAVEGVLAVHYGEASATPEDELLVSVLLDHAALAMNYARRMEQDRDRMQTLLAAIENPEQRQMIMSAMAHDLRSPLLGLRMGCDLLEGTLASPTEEQQELLSHMRVARNHLQAIAENMLEMGRLTAGMANVSCRMEPLEPILNEAITIAQAEAALKNISIEAHTAAAGRVLADEPRLRQVFVNLLGNAVKFSPEGAVVKLQVVLDPEAERCRVAVIDQGPGISPRDIDSIFIPYHRAGTLKRTSGTGVGLGLAIAREMSRKMGGDVTVDSREGSGSTFTVSLRTSPA